MTPTPKAKTHRTLSDAIRERVAEQGKTLDAASRDMGLAGNALSRWNQGIEPRPESYGVLMKFLGVTLEELAVLIVEDQLRRYGLPRP